MKNSIIVMCFLLTTSSFASIEHDSKGSKATAEEISRNRACFQELATQGCGDPGEDPAHFRACLKHVFPALSGNCKTMMTNLYGTK